MLSKPKLPPPPASLDERIDVTLAEIEALIVERVAAAKVEGVPEGALRQMFDAKYGRCACRAYKSQPWVI